MPEIITAKLDVMKIDKSKLFPGKAGAKYLDIVLIPSKNDKYGNDYMVVQCVSKEERDAGKRGAILGNAKIIAAKASSPQKQGTEQPEEKDDDGDDVPF